MSLSSSIGAFAALAVLFLTLDYMLGLVLFASPDSPVWRGFQGIPEAGRGTAVLLGIKGICQAGVLATAPLAVLSLFGRTPAPATLWAGSVLVFATLGGAVCMLAGVFPRAWGVLAAVLAVPEYAAYIACFVILARNRNSARSMLSRGIVRAALFAFSFCVPVLLANDVLALAGASVILLPTDALGFFVLSGGTLVCSLLVLLGGRRRLAPVDIDAFCAEHELSVREREVMLMLVEGLRYKQIAQNLGISMDTVKSHVSRIYRKTEAADRTDLLYRIRLGRL